MTQWDSESSRRETRKDLYRIAPLFIGLGLFLGSWDLNMSRTQPCLESSHFVTINAKGAS